MSTDQGAAKKYCCDVPGSDPTRPTRRDPCATLIPPRQPEARYVRPAVTVIGCEFPHATECFGGLIHSALRLKRLARHALRFAAIAGGTVFSHGFVERILEAPLTQQRPRHQMPGERHRDSKFPRAAKIGRAHV